MERCDECIYKYCTRWVKDRPCTTCESFGKDDNFFPIKELHTRDLVAKLYGYWYTGKIEGGNGYSDVFMMDNLISNMSDIEDIEDYVSFNEFMKAKGMIESMEWQLFAQFEVDHMFIKMGKGEK